ncbi:MAG TPA: RnfABCDGE type electron transport complex subunit D, partial [Chitinophagaceae bacterium]|nr:RnfABCDGE type electron transport complex subunit D [Chitinophagaceae bacterium]
MFRLRFALDPRWFQVLFQLFFLSYGIFFLDWTANWWHYAACIGGCVAFNYMGECIRQRQWVSFRTSPGWMGWGCSALISALSLCLLLKTNHWYTSLLAAFLTIGSKYLFRFNHKHIFNPSAFGIAAILLTGQAWLSPGQWGNNTVLFFLIITLGTIVVTRVQKLDTSLAFLVVFTGLLYWRQVYVLGWPADYFAHSLTNGGLLLFSFFMISDPKTSPNHPVARILWAGAIAATAFYLAAFKWMYNTPIVVLVMTAP